jgi:hypothetical protein
VFFRRLRSAGPLVVALLVGGAALAGCGTGPAQIGSAAIVGSQSVPLSQVQSTLDAALREPEVQNLMTAQGATPADVARFLVSREVQHLLLTEQAARDGITVGDAQVLAELAKPSTRASLAGKLAFDPQSARMTVRDQLIAEALASRYLDGLAVTVDLVKATSRADALAAARQLADGPAQLAALQAARPGNAVIHQQLRAALQPELATQFLFGTPAGQTVLVQTGESPEEWLVVRIDQRSTGGPAMGGLAAAPLDRLDADTKDSIGRRFTQPLAERIGVRINPRYGQWDMLSLSVVEPGKQSGSILTDARLRG